MPPKKNKKPAKNGFWQFLLEVRDKQPNKHLSMGELQEYAGRKWTAMSKEERLPYDNRAGLARDGFRSVKLTTDGLEVEDVERKEKELITKQQEMKNEITRNLKAASFALTLEEQIFLITHINHLTYYPAQDKYFICEVAVAAVSLKNGVEEVFHRLVKPGKIPLGFYGGALAHSKETHQLIEIVHDEPYENNTEEVFNEITHFMRKYGTDHNLPILYVDEKTFEMTTNVINNFCREFNFRSEIKVYNYQYMFFALRNAVAGRNIWPTETFSYNEVEKDIYSYTPDISCDFHEVSDISLYCSKSIVTRYGYMICDHCCSDLKIQLIPGFHVPKKSKVQESSRFNSKAPSVCSNDDYRHVNVERSRVSSFTSGGYEDNFPSLGSSRSSVSSVRTPRSFAAASTSKAAARIEQSFKAISINEAKRDHKNLKFPEHGCKKHDS